MPIKWKTKKNLKPSVIVDKIEKMKSISSNGEISFSGGIEFEFAQLALETMIEFKGIEGRLRKDLVWQAISSTTEKLSPENIIQKINEFAKRQNAKPNTAFQILTSISLCKQQQPVIIEIEDCKIELLNSCFPKKYAAAREKAINTSFQYARLSANEVPNDYTNVIITVSAKSPSIAVSKALHCLDLQRAIWCLLSNSVMQIMGNEWEPINKIRLGEIHTVHSEDGELASEAFWYEPNFVKAKLFDLWNQSDNFEKNDKYYLAQLGESKYSEKLKDVLLRYVRALDERDQNNALIKLWGAIESLTISGQNCDSVIKRCAFLYSDYTFHKQVLEHLREYRNQSVHAGDQSEEAKNHCYQLQFYFRTLIQLHINKAQVFHSLEEANEFLDLPPDKENLLRKKELIESALSFVG